MRIVCAMLVLAVIAAGYGCAGPRRQDLRNEAERQALTEFGPERVRDYLEYYDEGWENQIELARP